MINVRDYVFFYYNLYDSGIYSINLILNTLNTQKLKNHFTV